MSKRTWTHSGIGLRRTRPRSTSTADLLRSLICDGSTSKPKVSATPTVSGPRLRIWRKPNGIPRKVKREPRRKIEYPDSHVFTGGQQGPPVLGDKARQRDL